MTSEILSVLVCGGRDFSDKEFVYEVLDALRLITEIEIINGGARGADYLAKKYGTENGLGVITCPADWDTHGKSAGYLRNKDMLALSPKLVVAFPGGRGTADMVRQSKKAGVEVIQYEA